MGLASDGCVYLWCGVDLWCGPTGVVRRVLNALTWTALADRCSHVTALAGRTASPSIREHSASSGSTPRPRYAASTTSTLCFHRGGRVSASLYPYARVMTKTALDEFSAKFGERDRNRSRENGGRILPVPSYVSINLMFPCLLPHLKLNFLNFPWETAFFIANR